MDWFSSVLLFVSSYSDVFVFILYYIPLKACFLMRGRKGVELDERKHGEELGEEEGGDTVIRIYCVEKKSIFDERKRRINPRATEI